MADQSELARQAELDLHALDHLLGAGCYGTAAFCGQQAVEKYLKAYMVYKGLAEEPKFRHMPYEEIFHSYQKHLAAAASEPGEPESGTRTGMIMVMKDMEDLFADASKLQETRRIIWRISLGIGYAKSEYDGTRKLHAKIRKIDSKMREMLGADPEHMPADPDQTSLHHWQFQPLPPVPADGLLKSLDWLYTMLMLLPHAIIGRYPEDVQVGDDVYSSIDLYSMHRGALYGLLAQARLTCDLIRKELDG